MIFILVKYHLVQSNSDVVSAIAVALESIHAAITIMAYDGMPKQIYKEEVYALPQTLH